MKRDKVSQITILGDITGYRIAYLYDTTDSEKGTKTMNTRGNFPIIQDTQDETELMEHITFIKEYIEKNKLNKYE